MAVKSMLMQANVNAKPLLDGGVCINKIAQKWTCPFSMPTDVYHQDRHYHQDLFSFYDLM
jgi:hypothetical protein